MKDVPNERILHVVRARRKGRSKDDQTPFEIGVGIVTDHEGNCTGEIRLRTEQISSGVAPVVGTFDIEAAEKLAATILTAIELAKQAIK